MKISRKLEVQGDSHNPNLKNSSVILIYPSTRSEMTITRYSRTELRQELSY
jgi:hypothetical protein